MTIYKRWRSTPDMSPEPKSVPGLTPAMTALSFTIILIQVQTSAQRGVSNLLFILVAGLLTLAGVARHDHPEA
jgi:hypothetical protein